MSESKEYVSQTLEHGAIHISEEVIATIAALAVQDVEGVYGLNTTLSSSELSKLAKRAQQGKGIRLVISEDDEISVDCYIVVLYGHSVVDVAKAVQETVTSAVESTTGRKVKNVNVNISGITLPRPAKKP
ncbi:MAG TPA: Asp23/Gls24 family envelope stress response protein [Candidatus Avoscillospira stercorigallinarum]|uniref:Asp23/Gls24 family envelope stress response protein n=1 Tax=Candidatus Avoscillospira stercorigallinarum TaxID=2840708 RepID=A0A9D0Z4X6_9FIRM|nr:Asp23/Gls24 family envelope stress response protein [Candidatus Avoscillospira stercorigallinarum]